MKELIFILVSVVAPPALAYFGPGSVTAADTAQPTAQASVTVATANRAAPIP